MKDFLLEVPLRWGDMDAMAHLNNVMYFRLMEEARIQWFGQFDLPTLPTGEACILAHVSCDFVRAMTYPGVALVRQQFLATLEGLDVRRLDPAGQPFDPAFHEAVSTVPAASPDQAGLVIGVVRPGYRLGDEVLRPAQVAVASSGA